MKLRNSLLKAAASPVIADAIRALSISSVRTMLAQVGDIDALTDNSTGAAAATIAAVPTQDAKVAQSSTNLAPRAAFNTNITAIGNALSVLMEHLNDNGFTPLGLTPYGEGNGTIAASGTVAAITKSVTGVDGTSDTAILRSEMNAAITRARNNLATVIQAYNDLALAIGVAQIVDASLGSASQSNALSNIVTGGTTVDEDDVADGDLGTKAAADLALDSLADNVATLAAKINSPLFATANQSQIAATTVVVLTR